MYKKKILQKIELERIVSRVVTSRKDHNKQNLLEGDNITNKIDKHRPGASIINLGTTRALI